MKCGNERRFLFERVIDLRADFMERAKKAINDCELPEYVRISDKQMYVPRSGGSYDYLSTYIYTISGIILFQIFRLFKKGELLSWGGRR